MTPDPVSRTPHQEGTGYEYEVRKCIRSMNTEYRLLIQSTEYEVLGNSIKYFGRILLIKYSDFFFGPSSHYDQSGNTTKHVCRTELDLMQRFPLAVPRTLVQQSTCSSVVL
jgi:hypothetical protein